MKSLVNVALYLLVLNFCICLISAKEENKSPSAPLDVAQEKSNLRYRNEGSKHVGKKKAASVTPQDSNSKKGQANVNKGENGIPDFDDSNMTTVEEGHQSLPNEEAKVKPETVTDKKEKGERKKGGKKSSGGQTVTKSETERSDSSGTTGKRKKGSKKGESHKKEKNKQEGATPEKDVTMLVDGEQVNKEGDFHVPNAEQGVAHVDVYGPNGVDSWDTSISYEKNEAESLYPQVTDQDGLPVEMPTHGGDGTAQWNSQSVEAPGYSDGVEPVKGGEASHNSDDSHNSEGVPKAEEVEGKNGSVKNETSKGEQKTPSGIEESKQNGANQDGNKKEGFSKKDLMKLFHEHIDLASLVESFKSNEKLQKMSEELVSFAVKAYDGFLVFVEQVKFFANDVVQIIQNL
ncbi:conserved Plasmodium protein, unknown function [Plasmodium vivax]|uniref:Uncharacterized protein n=1 Tax=Plasmodium vivax Mauritania I TaxID=1035515 RepID=A0A0J9W1U1_PLAVI|nr:hypothetical protein PVMG_02324 [Plasmodium vivax Mauritania I]CAI7719310.1 conserved Plasmodium protein, unknown function [Plasmodium vivax]